MSKFRTVFLPVLMLGILASGTIPSGAHAATLDEARTLVVSEAPKGNAYYAGTDVRLTAPMPADVAALGVNVAAVAPIAGDAMFGGGSIEITKQVTGDLRAAGGQVTVSGDVGGDVAIAAGTVTVSGKAGTLEIAGGTVRVTGGATSASSTVTIYGADVFLSGEYAGNVKVVASDHLTVGDGTLIHGALEYNAPVQAEVPASAVISGGATYIGASSFLPTVKEAHTFAIAGIGVFFVVKALAAIIVAGLIVGLFPALTERVAERILVRSPRRFVLAALLGFGVLVATPLLVLFLVVSFVGIGLALLIGVLYVLLLIFAYAYAGTLTGAALLERVTKSRTITWRTAIVGTLVLYLIGSIPIIGKVLLFVLVAACAGALVSMTYRFIFKRGMDDLEEDILETE